MFLIGRLKIYIYRGVFLNILSTTTLNIRNASLKTKHYIH